ncbi:MAG: PQQ-binding-like beta-propeller repeat protein [Planctomycetota bacterium]
MYFPRRSTATLLAFSTAFAACSLNAFAQGQEIISLDAEPGDFFGSQVAMFGNTALITAPGGGQRDGVLYSGTAYLFDTTTGKQLAELAVPNLTVQDTFGTAIAIGQDTAIVGGGDFNDVGRFVGVAYLFDTRTGEQLFRLTAPDLDAVGEFSGVGFGSSVGVSGTTAIIGASGDDQAGTRAGAAYLFDTVTGQQLFRFTASDAQAEDRFGESVAISGSHAIVGGRGDAAYLFDATTGEERFKLTHPDADNGGRFFSSVAIDNGIATVYANEADGSGSVYLFDAATGNALHRLTPSDASADISFRSDVAISGDTVIVTGSSRIPTTYDVGSAYLFNTATGNQIGKLAVSDRDATAGVFISAGISDGTAIAGAISNSDAENTTGIVYRFSTTQASPIRYEQTHKLTASDATTVDLFGTSVALSGGTAIVGAPGDDDAGPGSGSAYLFGTTTGSERLKLTASDAAAGDFFGTAVSVDAGTAIVGAPRNDGSGTDAGSAYLFNTSSGFQTARLTASDAAAGDQFGGAVAIRGGYAIVGSARDDDAGASSGSAYLFDANTAQELFKLTASDAQAGDLFGASVGISGQTAIVGTNNQMGSAYLFDALTGTQLSKLTAADAEAGDYFGFAVGVDDGVAIVGAPRDDDGASNTGSAYLFDAATGSQTHKLTASDAQANDQFGFSVAISDGTAVVGSIFDDGKGVNTGAAYLFDAVTGNQIGKLMADDAREAADFARSVGISGADIIVGASRYDPPPRSDDDFAVENPSDTGAAYLFSQVRTDMPRLREIDKLSASDAEANDFFGAAVAVSGRTAIVGAQGNDDAGSSSGSAYLYDTVSGNQIAKLTAGDPAPSDIFGGSVAIGGNTAIVGAYGDDDDGSFSGSAYVFDATTGQQLRKLTASDAGTNDYFGFSVGISNNTAIIGAVFDSDVAASAGSAYLFDTTSGDELLKLTASDAESGDFFGRSVAISGTTAIVGADGDDDAGSSTGSAYFFDTTSGNELSKLTASDAAAGDRFGFSVGISGDTAIVGSYQDDDAGFDSGSAYLFDAVSGSQLHKLTATDAEAGDRFGYSVAIDGTTAIVGAYRDDDGGFDSGSAYLFDTLTGNQIGKLNADDAEAADQFGFSVAIDGDTIVVGASGDDDDGASSGSAYVFAKGDRLGTGTGGETITFSTPVNTSQTQIDAIELVNITGGTLFGFDIDINGFLITGENAGLFSVSDFANATLTDGETMNYDLFFSGADTFGTYDAMLTLFTDVGNVQYDIIADVMPVLGDLNCDGVLDNLDIDPFIQALIDPAQYALDHGGLDPDALGDFNDDGTLDNLDIFGFVNALTGGQELSAEQVTLFEQANLQHVPEPGSLALLALGGLASASRRRR